MSNGSIAAAFEGILFTVFQRMRQKAQEQAGVDSSAAAGLVFAFTSVNPGEGVTHTVRALLDELAREGTTQSLLVPATVLRGLNVAPGQVKSLCSPLSASAQSPLWELSDAAPDRRRTGAKMWEGSWQYRRDVLQELKLLFDYTFLDCPALNTATDILSVAPFVDGVILIIEAGRTRKDQIRNAEKSIKFARGRLLGHILNKRSYVVPEWLYRRL